MNEKDNKHRNSVFKEIVATEQSYVDSLQTIIREYVVPLKREKLVDDATFRKIFSYLETIVNANQNLLYELKRKEEGWDNNKTCIGDIFVKFAPFFKMYSEYCKNYQTAINTLTQLRKNPKFTDFENNHPLPLSTTEAFLIMPVQRIPRYTLLLQDFIDHTSEDHDDYRQLLQALSDLKRIANSVNESMKVGDTVQRVIDIDTTLGGQELIAPHRRWVKDDEFTKLESPMGIYLKTPIHLYLFNDILVIAQKIISGFGFKYSAIRIELNNLFVYPYLKSKKKSVFVIACHQAGCLVRCNDQQQMIDWVLEINNTTKSFISEKRSNGYDGQRESLAATLNVDYDMIKQIETRGVDYMEELCSQNIEFASSRESEIFESNVPPDHIRSSAGGRYQAAYSISESIPFTYTSAATSSNPPKETDRLVNSISKQTSSSSSLSSSSSSPSSSSSLLDNRSSYHADLSNGGYKKQRASQQPVSINSYPNNSSKGSHSDDGCCCSIC